MVKSSTDYARITKEYEEWSKLVRADYLKCFEEPTHESLRRQHFVYGVPIKTMAKQRKWWSNETKQGNYLNEEAIHAICYA